MKKRFSQICAMLVAGTLLLTACDIFPQKEAVMDEKKLWFQPHDEILDPYIDEVKAYLEAGAKADVGKFSYHQKKQMQDVTLSWDNANLNIKGYTLELSTHSDFSDAQKFSLSKETRSIGLKYLLRDTKYYVRLTTSGADRYMALTEFSTPYLGPRFLDVGGKMENCRDLGGYRVDGRTVLYNMVIRGSSPDFCSADKTGTTLSEEGFEFLSKEVGIRTQLDLRATSEIFGRTESTFPGAAYRNIPISAYGECFSKSQAQLYREVFQLFADPANYPVYFHCFGGADRTGTVSMLLLALLGVSEDEIVQDYVVTTFTPVCASQDPRSRDIAMNVLNKLDSYNGETLSERCTSYLKTIGLTRREISNIRAIMFGNSLAD